MEWIASWPWGLLLLLAVFVLWGYGDSVADTQKVAERVREKLHIERMAAIEKGLPIPDAGFDDAMLAFLAGGGAGVAARQRGRAQGWGILLLAAGFGWFLMCTLTSADGPYGWLYHTRAFGLLPGMLGLGALLHVALTRTQD